MNRRDQFVQAAIDRINNFAKEHGEEIGFFTRASILAELKILFEVGKGSINASDASASILFDSNV